MRVPDLLKNCGAPILFVRSDMDLPCPMTEGRKTFNALQCWVESRLMTFPSEDHFVLNTDYSLQ